MKYMRIDDLPCRNDSKNDNFGSEKSRIVTQPTTIA